MGYRGNTVDSLFMLFQGLPAPHCSPTPQPWVKTSSWSTSPATSLSSLTPFNCHLLLRTETGRDWSVSSRVAKASLLLHVSRQTVSPWDVFVLIILSEVSSGSSSSCSDFICLCWNTTNICPVSVCDWCQPCELSETSQTHEQEQEHMHLQFRDHVSINTAAHTDNWACAHDGFIVFQIQIKTAYFKPLKANRLEC